MSQVVADLLLLLITIIWGTTFVIVKEATVSIKPFTFLAVRFFVAALLCCSGWLSGACGVLTGHGAKQMDILTMLLAVCLMLLEGPWTVSGLARFS